MPSDQFPTAKRERTTQPAVRVPPPGLGAPCWCAPCFREIDALQALFGEYRERGLAPVLQGWAILVPTLYLVPSFDVPFLVTVAASIIILPASGTILAIRRAASADPDAVIRE